MNSSLKYLLLQIVLPENQGRIWRSVRCATRHCSSGWTVDSIYVVKDIVKEIIKIIENNTINTNENLREKNHKNSFIIMLLTLVNRF